MARNGLTGKDNTNGFQKNPQNINRSGANRKTINAVNLELENNGYTEANANDIKSCYLRLINVDVPELKNMITDDNQPALIRIVGKAIISGKGFEVIENMLNRSIGRPQSNLDVTTKGEQIQQQPIIVSTEQQKEIIEELLKKE